MNNLETLASARNEIHAVPTAYNRSTDSGEGMETEQRVEAMVHQQNSDTEQPKETLEMDNEQPELGRKLNIQIPVDEDRIDSIARRILEEKRKVEKLAAERIAHFKKKYDLKKIPENWKKEGNPTKTSYRIQRQ
ncbi:hypothetical protein JTB14_016980 [Gonioctena quinquepunctata]|nr:hypothetical protein JTB14_016980 [Gonioctena quinquepunctata]